MSVRVPVTSRDAPVVTIACYTALPERLPLQSLTVRADEVHIEIESALPGGWTVARVGIIGPDSNLASEPRGSYPFLPAPLPLDQERMHVELRVGGAVVFAGVPGDSAEPGARLTSFTLDGYGVEAVSWSEAEFRQDTETSCIQIVRASVARNPVLRMGALQECTRGRHSMRAFDGMALSAVLNQLIREGGHGDGAPWSWDVYEGQLLNFYALREPQAPDYLLSVTAGHDVTRSRSGRVDAVRMVVTDPGGVERETGWFYAPGIDPHGDVVIRRTLRASIPSTTSASQFARSYVTQHHGPRTSLGLVLPAWQRLTTADGRRRHAYLARAGQWARLRGLGTVPLSSVGANLSSGDTRVQFGDPPASSWEGFAGRLSDTVEAERAGVSAVTGAKERRFTLA